ncbi:MAG: HesA/MoeB/ThiF family protein [Methanobacteriota archaeon]
MTEALRLEEERYDRALRIPWFDLARMRRSSVLLLGAGALGNEAGKNLALSGVGRITVVDMDRVTASNLHRCALFTSDDAERGRPKAEALADALRRLVPDLRAVPVVGRLEKLSIEDFAGYDVVVAGLDSVAARDAANERARAASRALVDGGTRGTLGKVFVGVPSGPCVGCVANATHAETAALRFACTGREDVVVFEPTLAAEPVTTSVIGAVMAREAVKLLHGKDDAVIKNLLYYDGMANRTEVFEVDVHPRCRHHGPEAGSGKRGAGTE